MATDERFVLVPYAGVNPTSQMVYSVGIDSVNPNYKIASGVQDSSYEVMPVYICGVASDYYAISQYTVNYNKIYKSMGTGTLSTQNLDSTHTITGTSVQLRYRLIPANSDYIPAAAIGLGSFSTLNDAAIAFLALFPDDYVNITYVGNGCSVGGLPYVETGTGVVVPVTLPMGTSLTAGNISVTKNGSPINFNYNPQTQQIAFTAI